MREFVEEVTYFFFGYEAVAANDDLDHVLAECGIDLLALLLSFKFHCDVNKVMNLITRFCISPPPDLSNEQGSMVNEHHQHQCNTPHTCVALATTPHPNACVLKIKSLNIRLASLPLEGGASLGHPFPVSFSFSPLTVTIHMYSMSDYTSSQMHVY